MYVLDLQTNNNVNSKIGIVYWNDRLSPITIQILIKITPTYEITNYQLTSIVCFEFNLCARNGRKQEGRQD
jgi:hypothetical protein